MIRGKEIILIERTGKRLNEKEFYNIEIKKLVKIGSV